MQSIGLDFFHRNTKYYIILIDHFSGLPMIQKMRKTTAQEVIMQLKNWFSTFKVARLIRANNGPPLGSKERINERVIKFLGRRPKAGCRTGT